MTQDGPEAQTWTEFEEVCDAVNLARAPKIKDSGYSAYQCVFGRNLHRWKMPFGMWKSRPGRSEPAADRRINTRTVDDCETPWIINAAGNEPCTMQRNTTRANYMLDNPFGSGYVERMLPRNQQMLFGTRALSSATRWPQFGLPTAVPQSSVHDLRCDRFTRMTRRPMNTSRNT